MANLETIYGLTVKAFEGMEKLVELNLQAAKAALNESAQQCGFAGSFRRI